MPTLVRAPASLVLVTTKASGYSATWTLANVRALSVQLGFDQQLRQATVTVPGKADLPAIGDKISISAGDSVTSNVVRFYGYVAEYDFTLYPLAIGIICTGPLQKALTYRQPAGNGVDLSNSGAGQADTDIIKYILNQAGLPNSGTPVGGFTASIGGLGRSLGTVAKSQTRWNEGETALAAIQKIDQICLGYRTYETANQIVRAQITTVPSGTPVATYTEGVDIADGTSSLSILDSYYSVLVSGYNSNKHTGNTIWLQVTQANTHNIPWATNAHLSNSLIEFIHASDILGGVGIACEEVADWLLNEYNRVILRATFTALTDYKAAATGTDGLEPGDVIRLTSPLRLGISGLLWVQNVTTTVDEAGAFAQKIVALCGGNA